MSPVKLPFFLCLQITVLCCYGGGFFVFDGVWPWMVPYSSGAWTEPEVSMDRPVHGRTWTDGRTSMDCYKNKQGIRRSPCSENWYINYFNVSGYVAIVFLCLLITA